MNDKSLVGESLLGMPGGGRPRGLNTFPLWRYVLIAMVMLIGVIYALPNLYQPDPALQVRLEAADAVLDADIGQRIDVLLSAAGLQQKSAAMVGGNYVVRMRNNDDQLRAKTIISEGLKTDSDGVRYVVALNRAPTTPEWLLSLGASPMSYGLDLSGGVHFLLQVDMDKAVADRMESEEANFRLIFREHEPRLRYVGNDWVDGTRLRIGFRNDQDRDLARVALQSQYSEFTYVDRDVDANPGLIVTMSDQKIREIEDDAISQNRQSIKKRINELGVSEPLVQRLGRSRIVVDLPGVQDSAAAKRILNKFANLEFRLVAAPDTRSSLVETYVYEGQDQVIERHNIVTGDRVIDAQQGYDPDTGLPQVSITLDSVGGSLMNATTGKNIGNRMAILFKELIPRERKRVSADGEEETVFFTEEKKRLINVATIQGALGYRFRITGLGLGEARDLALLLRAGALKVPMYIVEERTVGASLGDDNIKAGGLSMVLGLSLVLLFMLGYYRMFGLAANIALTANIILLVAVMSVLGATLTLPGIAGIVLTIGMAVDANVLIFSRIREELKNNSPQQAIHLGFDRAFLTILDANITTFFVAIVLLGFGSGPVKGFAITLAIGILTSMFTAILGTRAIINLMYGGRSVKKLAI